jgi:lactate dehydrogenase-like 2-hydroxyacid dehydrogenase
MTAPTPAPTTQTAQATATKVFVPQQLPEAAMARLNALATVETFDRADRCVTHDELLAFVSDKDVLVALGQIPYDREVIEAARRCQLIAVMHSRGNFVDIDAATANGIVVSGIPTDVSRTTAEFTFAMVVGTSWRLAEADRFLRAGRWAQNQSTAFLGSRLFGKTLGIVGMGIVGQGVAKRALACDMTILYNKRSRLPSEREAELGAAYRDIDSLFRESDIVVLTVALTDETRGLVGERLLSLMKPTALLINTSRGAVIDELALERALRDRRIAGAGLDVYDREPPNSHPGPTPGLLELPNVLLTPHIGTAARETREELAALVVDRIASFIAGDRPETVLNPEVYERPIRRGPAA